MRIRSRSFLAIVALAAGTALPATAAWAAGLPRPPSGRSLYDPPAPLPPGQPGSLVWAEPVKTAIPGALAWRVLYLSTDLDGSPRAASGLVVAPKGPAPVGGRPVVTFAHGTTGLARACAPSAVPDPAKDGSMYFSMTSSDPFNTGIPLLPRLLAAGYVVAATDYAGLGTPGPHRYLIGPAAARNVLDAAVAARHVPGAGAGRRVVVYGWSQGGQAAIWAAQMADYAKGRAEVLGAVALAPVNAAAQLELEKQILASGRKVTTVVGVETVMALQASAAAFPELRLSDVLTPFGVEFIETAGPRQCSQHLGLTLDSLSRTRGPAIRGDPQDVEAWARRATQMALGQVPAQVPVAVFQGQADETVYPGATEIYVKEACAKGSTVHLQVFPGVDHLDIPARSADETLDWIAGRLAGRAAPTSCR